MIALVLALAATQDAPRSGIADPVPASTSAMREFDTDRPDKTESPHTVDAGHVQIELDLATFTTDRDGTLRTRTLNVAPVNLKLGIAPNTDIQIVVDNYVHQRVEDRKTGARQSAGGFGDVTVRLKHNLWGNDGGTTAFALMPFVKLPTSTNGIGNAHVEGGVIAPLAIELSGGLGLGLMTEVDLLRNAADTGYAATFINSATLSGDIAEGVGLYGEVYTEIASERDSRLVATFDTGLTFAIGDDAQFDLGANIGVTDAADDLMVFVGFSRRF